MKTRSLLAGVVFSSLAIAGLMVAPDFGRAKDGASDQSDDYSFDDFMEEIKKDKEDQRRCRGTGGGVSKPEQQAACTRLIDKAPYENDLVGEYYIMRATTHEDAAAQCKDVSKGIELIENSKPRPSWKNLLDAAHGLKESACG
jgi:hypothetical protein